MISKFKISRYFSHVTFTSKLDVFIGLYINISNHCFCSMHIDTDNNKAGIERMFLVNNRNIISSINTETEVFWRHTSKGASNAVSSHVHEAMPYVSQDLKQSFIFKYCLQIFIRDKYFLICWTTKYYKNNMLGKKRVNYAVSSS